MSKDAKQAHREAIEMQVTEERIELGPYSSYSLRTDPKHLCFVLSRYKFCAKLLAGRGSVLEIGCGDAVGLPLVAQSVGHVYATDWDDAIIQDNKKRMSFLRNCTFLQFNVEERPFTQAVDAVYLLDVIEHLDPATERELIANIVRSLALPGVCIVGTPNVEASRYASPQSAAGHINLKGYSDLRKLMEQYFSNVFMFSMNDEVVHTGFYPMAHYLIALAIGVK